MSDQHYWFFLYNFPPENGQQELLNKDHRHGWRNLFINLLRSMSPQLNDGEYVFCTLPDGKLPAGLEIVGSFREQEGLTVILQRSHAEKAGFSFDYIAAGSP